MVFLRGRWLSKEKCLLILYSLLVKLFLFFFLWSSARWKLFAFLSIRYLQEIPANKAMELYFHRTEKRFREDQLQPCQWSSTKTCHKSKTTYHWNQPTIWTTFDHWHRTVINGSHSPSKLWRLLRRPDLTTRTWKANKSSKSSIRNGLHLGLFHQWHDNSTMDNHVNKWSSSKMKKKDISTYQAFLSRQSIKFENFLNRFFGLPKIDDCRPGRL